MMMDPKMGPKCLSDLSISYFKSYGYIYVAFVLCFIVKLQFL